MTASVPEDGGDDFLKPIFRESGTRRVKKILRDKGGRWTKRRTTTPVHGLTYAEKRAKKVPVPVHNLTMSPLSGLPPDVYERLDTLIGDEGKPPGWVADTAEVIRRVRGKPEAEVVVYTAVPPGDQWIAPLNWVSLAPGFARVRAGAYPGWTVLRATVPAAEVLTRSDDLLRWTWHGSRPVHNGGSSVKRDVRGRRTLP